MPLLIGSGGGPNGGDVYATGRQRTVRMTGTFSGIYGYDSLGTTIDNCLIRMQSNMPLVAGLFQLWIKATIAPITDPYNIFPGLSTADWQMDISTGLSGEVHVESQARPLSWTGESSPFSGSYTYEIDVEEVFEVIPGLSGPGFYDTLNDRTSDGPYKMQVLYYEILRPGGNCSMSALVTLTHNYEGGAGTVVETFTPSQTDTIPAGINPIAVYPAGGGINGYTCTLEAAIQHGCPGVGSSTATITGVVGDNYGNGFTIGNGQTYSDASKSYDLTTGISVTSIDTLTTGMVAVHAVLSQSPPWIFALTGRIRAMNIPYPVTTPIALHYGVIAGTTGIDAFSSGSASISRTDTQHLWGYSLDGFDPIPFSAGYTGFILRTGLLDEFRKPSGASANGTMSLDSAWLAGMDDDAADGRILFSGTPYDSFTLEHAANLSVDDCTSLTGWAAGSNTTLSLTSGVQADVSGGPGALTRTFVPTDPNMVQADNNAATWTQEWTAYAYLKVSIQSVVNDNQTFRVTVHSPYPLLSGGTTKSWTKQTGPAGTPTDVVIDLLSPDTMNGVAVSDHTSGQDNRYPMPTADGVFWGVSYVASVTIDNLSSGETYILTGIDLVRQTYARANFLPASLKPAGPPASPLLEFISGSPNPAVVRMFMANVDGRQAGEEPYVYHTVKTPGGGAPPYDAYDNRTLTQLLIDIGAHPGWTTGAASSFPVDGFHNNSLSAAYAWGGGALYIGGVWSEGFGRDATSLLSVMAQPGWDLVDSYPQIGDPWEGASGYDPTATEMPLRFTKILRGGGHGTVIDLSGARAPGQVVNTVESADGDLTGSGTSDSIGVYATGTPFGGTYLFPYNHQHSCAGFSLIVQWHSRKWSRVAFRIPTSTNPCNRICIMRRDAHGAGRRIWSNGTYIYEKQYYTIQALASGSAMEIASGVIALGTAPTGFRDARGILHLWYSRAGDIYYRQDVGAGWGAETMALGGYSCPDAHYIPELHRAVMVALEGGHAKAISWAAASPGDIALTPDLVDVWDLGASDTVCPAVEVMATGVAQCWITSGGNILTATSVDGGFSWTVPA